MTDGKVDDRNWGTRPLHPLPLRIMHWINAVAMIVMIGSGWKIYNDEVLFGWLHFPNWITIGGGAEGALQWHFLAMWILVHQWSCLSGLRAEDRALPAHAASDSPRRGAGRDSQGAAPRPQARRPDALQRRAAPPVHRHHRRHRRAGAVRLDHLEARSVLRAVVSLLRLPGRAARAFHRHGRDRRIRARACGAGAHRSRDAGRHADAAGRRCRRTPPAPSASADPHRSSRHDRHG